jgi:hypothetical protein
MDDSKIKIEFELTEPEYLAATRLYFIQARHVLMRLMIVSVLGLIGAALISLVADFFMWVTIAFVALVEAFVFYTLLVQTPRRYFRKDGKLHGRHEMTFSDAGIFLKTAKLESKLSWDLYTKVLESRDLYGLVYGKETRMMSTIPKRAFKDRNQENQFRQLIARHITDTSGMKNMPPGEPEYTPKSLTPPDWR